MLLPWEIKCNMTRTPMRSILIACVSALLVCGMVLYLRNIQVTEEALDGLAQQSPVTVRLTNRDGSLRKGVSIRGEDVDYLLASGVHDPVYTTHFTAKQLGTIHGTNTLDSLRDISGTDFTFLDGWDENFPASGKAVIALREDVARENGWQLGDKLQRDFTVVGIYKTGKFRKVGSYAATVIATYPGDKETPEAIMPVDWLRSIADSASPEGEHIIRYDSFHAVLDEPRELNAFKDAAEAWGFQERESAVAPGMNGNTLFLEDERYIKEGGKMVESLNQYRAFLLPFFVLVTLIMAMATFLALRSCRYQIAIASSLGRPKFRNAAAHFCSTVILQLAGCLLALLVLHLAVGLLPWLAGITLGVFTLCALGGTALALVFLFRFDTLTLLTKED